MIAQHFEKGSEIFVEGRFRPEEWTDREGQKRTTFGIQVSDFNFTGGSNRNGSRPQNAPASAPSATAQASADDADAGDDDIDFS